MPGVLRQRLPLIGVSFGMFFFHWNMNSFCHVWHATCQFHLTKQQLYGCAGYNENNMF
jgi:hypothetical protein